MTDAGADIAALRPQIMRLLDPAPFSRYGQVEYADAPAYAAQAGEAVDALRSLTAAGKAAGTVTMSREAIERLRRIYEEIDDSSGAVGEVAGELEEAHREACAAADPVETAEWLAAHMLGDWSYVPEIDLGDYWDLLGGEGRARSTGLVAGASRRGGWTARLLREDIARLEGDVDADAAWQAAGGRATDRQWLALADLACEERPATRWRCTGGHDLRRGTAHRPAPQTEPDADPRPARPVTGQRARCIMCRPT
ncbi:hypothetical protein [Actinomadura sp. DC4]|uniref:hypothetical protein n=1 Tax=Actinomadura sp. DC4 TaxID=3055069 RepID=UPI0025AEF8AF|nr:hypothetical protein [Actinomadura sp. DC4]MDN3351367.1 hypothetical protein [Actinomadura sp. DC4]